MISTIDSPLGFSVARRKTRRWVVVVYWTLALAFTGALLVHQSHRPFDRISALWVIQVIFYIPALLGGVRAGGLVKPFRGIRWAPLLDRDDLQTLFGPPRPIVAGVLAGETDLDERERRNRDRIHFISYTLIRWFSLLLFALYIVLDAYRPDWLARIAPSFLFLLTLTLWSLPQSLILWTEPDVEEPQ